MGGSGTAKTTSRDAPKVPRRLARSGLQASSIHLNILYHQVTTATVLRTHHVKVFIGPGTPPSQLVTCKLTTRFSIYLISPPRAQSSPCDLGTEDRSGSCVATQYHALGDPKRSRTGEATGPYYAAQTIDEQPSSHEISVPLLLAGCSPVCAWRSWHADLRLPNVKSEIVRVTSSYMKWRSVEALDGTWVYSLGYSAHGRHWHVA